MNDKTKDLLEKMNYEQYVIASKLQKEDSVESLTDAIKIYSSILDYKDSKKQLNMCQNRQNELTVSEKEKEKARANRKKRIIKLFFLILVIVILALGIRFLQQKQIEYNSISEINYSRAQEYVKSGNYDEAKKIFLQLGYYKDSKTQIQQTDYLKAKSYVESGNYDEAEKIFASLGDYGDSQCQKNKVSLIKQCKAGNLVSFGEYKWKVLEIEDNRALLITDYCVGNEAYDNNVFIPSNLSWETCTLRKWLNDEFYSNFNQFEKSVILNANNANRNNAKYGTAAGNDTQDKVFLLSIDEVERYFKNTSDRIATYNGEACKWWLRTPGESIHRVALVFPDGSIDYHGGTRIGSSTYKSSEYYVRPALWIDLNI